jgi:hypothetical protein
MGDGLSVYLMDTRTPDGSEPTTVPTLGAAPPDEVVSVDEQIDHLAAIYLWGDRRPTWVHDTH